MPQKFNTHKWSVLANAIQLNLIFRASFSRNPARRNARSALNNLSSMTKLHGSFQWQMIVRDRFPSRSFNKRGRTGIRNRLNEALKIFVSLLKVKWRNRLLSCWCMFRSNRFHRKPFNEMLTDWCRLKSTGQHYILDSTRRTRINGLNIRLAVCNVHEAVNKVVDEP